MWFNNLLIYRLIDIPEAFSDTATLEAALATKRARRCGSQELSAAGFCAPFGKEADAPLVHSGNDCLLISFKQENRILPGGVVREAVQEKISEIEKEQLRKVYKKERDQIKDEIVQALLPRAFTRSSVTFIAIDLVSGLVLANTSSPAKAEDVLSTLREAIGSLKVRPLSTKIAPSATLTEWVKNSKATNGFMQLADCELRDTSKDGGKIKAVQQDLSSEDILSHIASGMLVSSLAVAWEDKCSFTLNEKMVIKKLRYEDLLQDQAVNDGGDEASGQFAASFLIMTASLREMLPKLIEALGGEDIPQGI